MAGIKGKQLEDATIVAAKLASDSVTSDKIATGAVGSDEIATDAIGSSELDLTASYAITGTIDTTGGTMQAATPSADADVATKGFVNAAVEGLDRKPSVEVASTASINLVTGGLLTIDGITLIADELVLVKNQSSPIENGLYLAKVGSWVRDDSYDTTLTTSTGSKTLVSRGTTQAATSWQMLTTGDPVPGTDANAWTDVSLSTISGGDGVDVTGAVVSADLEAAGSGTGGLADNGSGKTRVKVGTSLELTAGGVGVSTNGITATQIASATITDTQLASNSVTTAKIVDGNVTLSKLAANSVDSSKIAANAVGTSEIAANAVTDTQLAANSVTAAKIVANTITATEIAADTITAAEIAPNAVDTSEIAGAAVTDIQLASNSVTTIKILNDAVTSDKLATDSVTADAIAAAAVGSSEIASNAVGSAEVDLTDSYDYSLTGIVKVKTQVTSNSTTLAASTAFVQQEIGAIASVDTAVLADVDQDKVPESTSGDASNSTLTITNTPLGLVVAFVNGIKYKLARVGGEKTTADCFFSGDGGTTARAMANIVSTDVFFWNGIVSGFDLANTDGVSFVYET